ncbi:hypothetical protein H696_05493 [Fonticula alba]|uniref:Nucleosome assembly protein 1-like 1 n=1 Tax=Fonticula alba TaxID=691883 RepID=A0A058Z1A9_FONAL|nr:hypothetical protein H696_05493 [Fonticula alba]KCV68025.1 hypothetical protein H696_05493 [Fonticula alba]|eukprot:XP_009497592.1 hypothetical protein H696_05493 [Fonticula alba]
MPIEQITSDTESMAGDVPMSPNLFHTISALESLQAKRNELEAQLRLEIFKLESEYQKKYNELYERRTEIISGASHPTEEELKFVGPFAQDLLSIDAVKDALSAPFDPATAEGIPNFWAQVLNNHPILSDLINDEDAEALEFLTNITADYDAEKLFYSVTFHFSENPYFTNETLVRTYYLTNDNSPSNTFMRPLRATTTQIDWKDGKNLIEEASPDSSQGSFFQFFCDSHIGQVMDEDMDSDDEGYASMQKIIQDRMSEDFQMGELIREDIVGCAIDWYSGYALTYTNYLDDDEEEYDEDDEEYDEDDEDDDDEDEDDEDDDAAPAGEQARPTECNQQ